MNASSFSTDSDVFVRALPHLRQNMPLDDTKVFGSGLFCSISEADPLFFGIVFSCLQLYGGGSAFVLQYGSRRYG